MWISVDEYLPIIYSWKQTNGKKKHCEIGNSEMIKSWSILKGRSYWAKLNFSAPNILKIKKDVLGNVYFIYFFSNIKPFCPDKQHSIFLHWEKKQLMSFYEGITPAKLQINNEILCWNVL